MPHAPTPAAVVDAIAAELEADLGCALPVQPNVLCAALGWRLGEDIPYDGDDRALAAEACARLVTLAGFSAQAEGGELVRALAARLCGAFLFRGGQTLPHALRKRLESFGADRLGAA